jgi:ribosomal protein S13
MKYILGVVTLMMSMTTFFAQSECEECKKLRKEIKEAWDATIMISKEIRALMEQNVKSFDTIRKYQS